MKFFWGAGCLISNKPFSFWCWFGSHPDPGIFCHYGRGADCRKFAGSLIYLSSTALIEVCTRWMFLVFFSRYGRTVIASKWLFSNKSLLYWNKPIKTRFLFFRWSVSNDTTVKKLAFRVWFAIKYQTANDVASRRTWFLHLGCCFLLLLCWIKLNGSVKLTPMSLYFLLKS